MELTEQLKSVAGRLIGEGHSAEEIANRLGMSLVEIEQLSNDAIVRIVARAVRELRVSEARGLAARHQAALITELVALATKPLSVPVEVAQIRIEAARLLLGLVASDEKWQTLADTVEDLKLHVVELKKQKQG